MKHYIIIDHQSSEEKFQIRKDKTTGAWKTWPHIKKKHAYKYYKHQAYMPHKVKPKSLFDVFYGLARKTNNSFKIRHINKRKSKGNMLDFGAGVGTFAAYAKSKGWIVEAYETDTDCKKRLKERKITIVDEKFCKKRYDVITLWHVLEHLNNPKKTLERLHNSLKPTGRVFIAIPNHSSWDAQHYKENWAAFDVPRHIWHYNKKSFRKLIKQTGFTIEKTSPMLIDAFYISILSEKYRKSNLPYLKGTIKGFYSNLKGMMKKNTSSLLFCLKKEF